MKCPHCGGAIDIVPAAPEPDPRQAELPFMVELRKPKRISVKKVLANEGSDFQTRASRSEYGVHVHGHVHGFDFSSSSPPSGHEHDHETSHELSAAEEDLLRQLEELTARENRTSHFRSTWILRIRDYPNAVFAAIGEVRGAKREGRIKKSVGGALNWNFEKFRDAARKRRRA